MFYRDILVGTVSVTVCAYYTKFTTAILRDFVGRNSSSSSRTSILWAWESGGRGSLSDNLRVRSRDLIINSVMLPSATSMHFFRNFKVTAASLTTVVMPVQQVERGAGKVDGNIQDGR
jgi:hypothetical protein